MKIIAGYAFAFIGCLLLQACLDGDRKPPAISAKEQMISTDKSFSEMSRRQGMKKAFIEFMDNDGILLRPNHPPIIGADAIDFLSQADDTSFTLTWKPLGGEMSSSGDLGFTYGTYSLQLADTALSGTYVSIWKKQPDGKWKFILDTGNEGTHAGVSSP